MNEHVLLVEDDEALRGAIGAVLRSAGMHVTEVGDGQAALEEFDQRTDVVVLDIMLPGLNGFDVCKELRQRSQAPIIVVTARDVTDAQFAALGAMHATFRAGDSYWAEKIEAAYIRREALNRPGSDGARYPQLEKGRDLAREPLEIGWPFQRAVLHDQGIVVAGPYPRLTI